MTTLVRARVVPLLLAAITFAGPAAAAAPAQAWRTVTAARQRSGADTLHVRVFFGAGTVQIAAATAPVLYDLRLHYDADRARPVQHYDAATHSLVIRSDSSFDKPFSFDLWHGSMHPGSTGGDDRGNELSLSLGRDIPLDLSLALGACDATLDLSNLAVHRLRLRTGASSSTLTFGTPNPIAMAALDIAVGAADLTVHTLGNARAQTVAVSTGVGGADLDLGGDWTGDMRLVVKAALGSVTLRVPNDVGIEARVATRLGSLDASGLTARAGAYYSANWATATRKVIVDGRATLASIEITRQ